MGLFHCPVGSPFYDDEACINCRMCLAKTIEEKVEASRKIREYLKTQAEKKISIGKIAVTGKGGAGKSSIVALLALVLNSRGYQVTVLDADESNPGLNRMLGFMAEPEPLIRLRDGLINCGPELGAAWLKQVQSALDEVPSRYVLRKNGLRFMMVGKIADPFQGCACSLADLARDLVAGLIFKEKDILLIDTEAGTESFGRGVERSVNTVLIAVEPSYNSLALAEKIQYMAEGMGIRNVRAILNKVPNEEVNQRLTEQLEKNNIKLLGTIFFDPRLNEMGLEGQELGGSRATQDMEKIADLLLS